MFNKIFSPLFSDYDLQLFAEGAAAEGGTAGDAGTTGRTVTGAASHGEQTPSAGASETPPDLDAEFKSLIKGKFKQQYNQNVEKALKSRFKNNQTVIDGMATLTPALKLLAQKLNVDPSDYAALSDAIKNDNDLYSKEALEKGVDVEVVKAQRLLQAENEMYRARDAQNEQEAKVRNDLFRWEKDFNARVKAVYSDAEFGDALENPNYINLLAAGIDVLTAYNAVFPERIVQSMEQVAQSTAKRVTDNIAAQGMRPVEGGAGASSSGVESKFDVSKLTDEQLEEYIARARRGEDIDFVSHY